MFTAKKKLHFPGTVRGMVIGPVALPNYQDSSFCKLKPAEKPLLYDKNRIAVGGPTEDSDVAPGKDDLIPVFYKCLPPLVAEEIAHICD